jgi:hypothetical protein
MLHLDNRPQQVFFYKCNISTQEALQCQIQVTALKELVFLRMQYFHARGASVPNPEEVQYAREISNAGR